MEDESHLRVARPPSKHSTVIDDEGISDSSSDCGDNPAPKSIAQTENIAMIVVACVPPFESDNQTLKTESALDHHVDSMDQDCSAPEIAKSLSGPFTTVSVANLAAVSSSALAGPFTSDIQSSLGVLSAPLQLVDENLIKPPTDFVQSDSPDTSLNTSASPVTDETISDHPELLVPAITECEDASEGAELAEMIIDNSSSGSAILVTEEAKVVPEVQVKVHPTTPSLPIKVPVAALKIAPVAARATTVTAAAAPVVSIRARSGSADLTSNRVTLSHTTTSSSATSSGARSVIRSVGSSCIVEEKETAERWRDRLWPSRALTSFCRSITRCTPPILQAGKSIFAGQCERDGEKKIRLTPHWEKSDLQKVINTYDTLAAHNAAFFLLLVEESREASMQDSSDFEVLIRRFCRTHVVNSPPIFDLSFA